VVGDIATEDDVPRAIAGGRYGQVLVKWRRGDQKGAVVLSLLPAVATAAASRPPAPTVGISASASWGGGAPAPKFAETLWRSSGIIPSTAVSRSRARGRACHGASLRHRHHHCHRHRHRRRLCARQRPPDQARRRRDGAVAAPPRTKAGCRCSSPSCCPGQTALRGIGPSPPVEQERRAATAVRVARRLLHHHG